jgi:hypothetical protein
LNYLKLARGDSPIAHVPWHGVSLQHPTGESTSTNGTAGAMAIALAVAFWPAGKMVPFNHTSKAPTL